MPRSVRLIDQSESVALTADGKPILSLPGRKVDVISCAFDAEEREFYTALEQKTALTFNKVRSSRRYWADASS